MNIERLQDVVDRLVATSGQRWLFIGIAVAAAGGASTICGVAAGAETGVVLAIVLVLAATACARADTHSALVAEGIVVWQWLATVHDPTTPWTIGVAWCLLMFHTLIALMAVTPITAVVAPTIVRRWLLRVAAVAATVPAVWMCVYVLDQRRTRGSVTLTAAGFVTLMVLVALTRAGGTRADQVDSRAGGYEDAAEHERT